MPKSPVPPHGGTLIDLLASPKRAAELSAMAAELPGWSLSARQLSDLEMLVCGAFSPLTGFLGQADHESVCDRMRLADGTLWPLPVTLDVSEQLAAQLTVGDRLALRDPEGVNLAGLTIRDLWRPDRAAEARAVFGTDDPLHPGVAELLHQTPPVCLGGPVEALQLPEQLDFAELRLAPQQLRAEFARRGWDQVVAFQTRSPIHRAHFEAILLATRPHPAAGLLVSPQVGMTDPGEHKHYALVRAWQAALSRFEPGRALLNLLPQTARQAGPREALLQAIVQQNQGASHFIGGPDQASPDASSSPRPFYPPYQARELVAVHQAELAIRLIPAERMVYLPGDDCFAPESQAARGKAAWSLSTADLAEMLARGLPIPGWFTWPEVERELVTLFPPRRQQGFCVLLTGLPSSGKSTIARGLRVRLLERGGRPVTLLDGDVVRTHLSKKLGFTKQDRDINIRRIGFVASEITKNGGVAICAPIAPYDSVRRDVRAMVEARGGFVLVHVATPLGVCEQRDRKGLYALARAGKLKEFTGISDPYEVPEDAELALDTSALSANACVDEIVGVLGKMGYIE